MNCSGGLYGQSRREEHGDFSGTVVREVGINALRHQDYCSPAHNTVIVSCRETGVICIGRSIQKIEHLPSPLGPHDELGDEGRGHVPLS